MILDGALGEIFGEMAGRGCRASIAANKNTAPLPIGLVELIDKSADRVEICLLEQLDCALDMFVHPVDGRTH